MSADRAITSRLAAIALIILASIAGCAERPIGHALTYQLVPNANGEPPATAEVVEAINRRLRSQGKAKPAENENISVEIFGSLDAAQLSTIKRLISGMGVLEFRITAEPSRADIANVIAQAQSIDEGQADVLLNSNRVAKWVTYSPDEFGPADMIDHRIIKRVAGTVPQALVLIDQWDVTGDYLKSASVGVDESGKPAVQFGFNSRGAEHFGQLTGGNLPNRATGAYRYLGIILDDRLLAAPSINSKVSDAGMISGGGMNEREVEYIVNILRAGRLPQAVRLIDEKTVATTARVPMSWQTSAILAFLGVAAVILLVIIVTTFATKRR